jgi:hypothetical protein
MKMRKAVAKFCLMLLTTVVGPFPVYAQTSILTQHYDNARTGQNTGETSWYGGRVHWYFWHRRPIQESCGAARAGATTADWAAASNRAKARTGLAIPQFARAPIDAATQTSGNWPR